LSSRANRSRPCLQYQIKRCSGPCVGLISVENYKQDVADAIKVLISLPGGSRLFRFEDETGLRNVTAPLLNEYLAEHLGGGFTAKDFRTWGGSLTAAVALAEHGPPTSESDATRAIAAAMRRVGSELGNTPAVARASYVSPGVIE